MFIKRWTKFTFIERRFLYERRRRFPSRRSERVSAFFGSLSTDCLVGILIDG